MTAYYIALLLVCEIVCAHAKNPQEISSKIEQEIVWHEREKDVAQAEQYDEKFVNLVGLLCGEGLMSTGGYACLEEMLYGLNIENKKIFDFGCGIGGCDTYLAQKHPGTSIIAVDVGRSVLAYAEKRAHALGVTNNIQFLAIEKNAVLPIADATVDVVFAKESFLHVQDKKLLLAEFLRILKPGGALALNDWFYTEPEFDEDMKMMAQIDQLEYNLLQPAIYCDLLAEVGFENISYQDTTSESLTEFRKHICLLEGDYNQKIKEEFGEHYLAYVLDGWKLNEKNFVGGKLRSANVKAFKKK